LYQSNCSSFWYLFNTYVSGIDKVMRKFKQSWIYNFYSIQCTFVLVWRRVGLLMPQLYDWGSYIYLVYIYFWSDFSESDSIYLIICLYDILCINRLTLILKIFGQCDTFYDVTDKSNNVSFEGLDIYIITIIVLTSISTFITAVILYLHCKCHW
jgi:hypothetical protein